MLLALVLIEPCPSCSPPQHSALATLLFVPHMHLHAPSAPLPLLTPRRFYGGRLSSSHILEAFVLLLSSAAAGILMCGTFEWLSIMNGHFRRIADRAQPRLPRSVAQKLELKQPENVINSRDSRSIGFHESGAVSWSCETTESSAATQ